MELLLALLFAAPVFAAEPAVPEPEKRWEPVAPRTLTVQLGYRTPALDFTLTNEGHDVEYTSKVASQTYAGIAYGSFGIAGAVSNGNLSDEDKARYGSSRANDWQFRFFGEKFTWDFFYQDYKGYYIENSEQIDPALNAESPRIQRGDIQSLHYGLQLFYAFSPERYHMGGAFDSRVRQIESGGSWVAFAGLDQHRLSADLSLVPAVRQADFGKLGTFERGNFVIARAGGGYAYTAVWNRKWYLSGLLTAALGAQRGEYRLSTGDEDSAETTAGTNVKMSLGYAGDSTVAGLAVMMDQSQLRVGTGDISMATKQATIFFGMRFGEIDLPFLDAANRLD